MVYAFVRDRERERDREEREVEQASQIISFSSIYSRPGKREDQRLRA